MKSEKKEIIKELKQGKWSMGYDQSYEEEYRRVHFYLDEFPDKLGDKIRKVFWEDKELNPQHADVVTEAYITFYNGAPDTAYIQIEVTHEYEDTMILLYDTKIEENSPEYWKKLRRAAIRVLRDTEEKIA